MSGASSDYTEMAQRLLMQEAADPATAEAGARAVRSVHQKLHYRMVPLIGATGMRALFERSVRVTSAAFPALTPEPRAASEDPTKSADAVAERIAALEPRVAWAAAVALFSNFFGLTSSLIGERLVLLVLQRAFPSIDVTAKRESE